MLSLLALAFSSGHPLAAPFKVRVLDDYQHSIGDLYGFRTSIAVTPDGRAQVAHSVNPAWRLRITSAPDGSGYYPPAPTNVFSKSLQLTGDGDPYIAYEWSEIDGPHRVRVHDDLYASPVFVAPREARSPALRLDDDGKAHVAFYMMNAAGTSFGVYWATDLFGPWNLDWVALDVDFDANSNEHQLAIALDPAGVPRVAYQDGYQVIYAEYDFPWQTEVVSESVTARNFSLDVDASDTPHILFSNGGEILHATRDGVAGWTVTLIDDVSASSGVNCSLVLDSQGEPHVSYWHPGLGHLRYAHRFNGGWVIQTVDFGENESLGQFNDIATDGYDNLYISYKQHRTDGVTSHDLRYASARDCNDNGIHDEDDITSGVLTDCDGNGQPDECEIAYGFAEDCDGDGVPDACEEDCDDNGIPDDCGGSQDCNDNGIPDLCEDNDCNGNGRPDDCDIADGAYLDCNHNGMLDVCEPPFESEPEYHLSLVSNLVDLRESASSFGDFDEDGDLDLVRTGKRNFSPEEISKVYLREPSFYHDIEAIGLRYLAGGDTEWGDYDNDGDLDFFLGGSIFDIHSFEVYENTGITCTPTNGNCFLLFDAFPDVDDLIDATWIDYDTDGDLDIFFVGEATRFYRNDGSEFSDVGTLGVSMYPESIDTGDYDADGDHDLLLTGRTLSFARASRIYRNDGGTFVHDDVGLTGLRGAGIWGDEDADGDLDVLLYGASLSGDTALLYRNDAGAYVDVAATGLGALGSPTVHWGDHDSDGDLDVLYWGKPTAGSTAAGIFRNEGGGSFTDLDMGFFVPRDAFITWADQDADGDLDVLMSGEWGSSLSQLYESECGTKNTPPLPPTNLQLSVDGTSHTFSWDPVSDLETPSPGLTYNLRVGTAPGASDILSAMADETTGFRQVSRPGNTSHTRSWTLDIPGGGPVFWAVQSIDGQFVGSVFATSATEAVCTVSPRSIDFGHVTGHADSSFTITNTGGTQLTGEVTSTCPDFILLSGGGLFSLGPFESLTVDVRFTPASVGAHACAIDLGVEGCRPLAYLGDLTGGMKILDVTDPASPQLLSTFPDPVLEMQVVDGLVYHAGEMEAFGIAGAFDPTEPYAVGSLAVSSDARDVRIVGTTAYVATSTSGSMHVIDVEQPTNPVLRGTYTAADHVWRLDVSGDYAYLAANHEGLLVVEADDPTDPDLDGQYVTPAPAWGVDVVGDVAYVASKDAGLQILDVSTADPSFIASLALPGFCDDVHVEGDLTYVASADSGLVIVDVSVPAAPVLVSRHQTGDWASSVDVFAGYAYVAARTAGLEIVDVRDPENPVLVGSYDTDGDARGIQVTGGVEVTGFGDAVVAVPEVVPVFSLTPGRPNPFRTITTLRFGTDATQEVSVTVFDIAGRRVRTLASGRLTPGRHTLRWDGRDAEGRAVPAGAYFVRLAAGSRIETRKIVCIR